MSKRLKKAIKKRLTFTKKIAFGSTILLLVQLIMEAIGTTCISDEVIPNLILQLEWEVNA